MMLSELLRELLAAQDMQKDAPVEFEFMHRDDIVSKGIRSVRVQDGVVVLEEG